MLKEQNGHMSAQGHKAGEKRLQVHVQKTAAKEKGVVEKSRKEKPSKQMKRNRQFFNKQERKLEKEHLGAKSMWNFSHMNVQIQLLKISTQQTRR